MRKGEVVSLALIIVYFAAAFYLTPKMPSVMASHWGISGGVNGHMPRQAAMLILPCITAVLFLILMVISRVDPKERMAEFHGSFDTFTVFLVFFMGFVYALMIAFNLGLVFDMTKMLAPAFAALFFVVGSIMEKAKPNYFIGIRTPWTLESPLVWEKTHALGGKLFKACALLALPAIFFPGAFVLLMLVPGSAAAAYLTWYSYSEFKKEKSAPASLKVGAPAREELRRTITVRSPDFTDGSALNPENTCDGADISPALNFLNVGRDAASLVLILEDVDASVKTPEKPVFCHWIAYDIPSSLMGFKADFSDEPVAESGIKQGVNDFQNTGYGGPCPKKGSHRYYFRVYALDTMLNLEPLATDWFKITAAIKGHVVGYGEIIGTYEKVKS
jgi:Raf kinase inhibitor-like YbhB/YbcL family protein